MKNTKLIILSFISSILLFSCSSVENYNVAIRIKPEKEAKYGINPNTLAPRNGNTLRGNVVRLDFITQPDTCPVTPNTKLVTKKYVIFVDSLNKSDYFEEQIPLEDILPIGQLINIERNKYDNVNFFETYNNPLLPKEV